MSKLTDEELVYPEDGTKYWTILDVVRRSIWNNYDSDIARFNSGNYYATKQEADLEYKWRLLNTKILRSIAILRKEDNWVVDWHDNEQGKCYLVWNRRAGCLDVIVSSWFQSQDNSLYFSYDTIQILRTLYTQEEFKFWLTKEGTL